MGILSSHHAVSCAICQTSARHGAVAGNADSALTFVRPEITRPAQKNLFVPV
ncbi:hypothetical protein Pmar_PMAR000253 [Perkinsus marinus ATCC 50983]|uniref:Uncharacterized protein n=1 Tax=Perkinsus marinus (strain ATCC 50983 / TXsc) TaxID=423536 RepID=C5LNY1_PERM5|nr:hypothetical protein Pmar_PMAR000253 [Perkinsus marinus ATCC 50983]EER01563.1 hypothetical protein Pmar_PMAR000253 [Perkinsus marinus ATCC 50983]|eukprot:XP_002768845.1 hypothetical protein Pmar_PMAR000253 [Perkinsus marinus ATCC 50983]